MNESLTVSKEILAKAKLIQTRANFLVDDLFSGEYVSTFKGRGIEFEEVREYLEGDDVRNIDWKVSARNEKTYVKVFKDERELTLFFVVDVSGSALFGAQGKTKEEVIAELTALLSYAAQKNNDKVSLVIFSDEVEHYIPPGKGKSHIWKIIREILNFIPKSRGTDISRALDFVAKVRKRRAVVFVISDFLGPDYSKSFAKLSSLHDVIAVQVFDQMERSFPKIGHVYLKDLETNEKILLDTTNEVVNQKLIQESEKRIENIKEICKKNKAQLIQLKTTDDYLETMVKFFLQKPSQKRRRK